LRISTTLPLFYIQEKDAAEIIYYYCRLRMASNVC